MRIPDTERRLSRVLHRTEAIGEVVMKVPDQSIEQSVRTLSIVADLQVRD